MRVCTFLGCDRPYRKKGLCNAHYNQQRRGESLGPLRARRFRPKALVLDGFKYCLDCEATLPLSDFTSSWSTSDRKASSCKRCLSRRVVELRYSLPRGGYQAMLDAQGGVCAICKRPDPSVRSLSVDHDHTCCPGNMSCGRCIRGLLCNGCNPALGMMQDNPDRLEAAARYVRKGVSR